MKNKKLIVLISFLSVIVLLVVLNSTVFTLQTIEYNWLTTKNVLQSKTSDEFSSVIFNKKGENIFLLNKTQILEKLEENNAYLKVISVETVFPNKIVVHACEREDLFAVATSDNNYFAVVDKEMKILEIKTASQYYAQNIDERPVKVIIEKDGLNINQSNFTVGSVINIEGISGLLFELSNSLHSSGYSSLSIRKIITSVSINLNPQTIIINSDGAIKTFTNSTRIYLDNKFADIEIVDATEDLTNKLRLGFAVYDYQHKNHISYGKISVYYSQDDCENKAIYSE